MDVDDDVGRDGVVGGGAIGAAIEVKGGRSSAPKHTQGAYIERAPREIGGANPSRGRIPETQAANIGSSAALIESAGSVPAHCHITIRHVQGTAGQIVAGIVVSPVTDAHRPVIGTCHEATTQGIDGAAGLVDGRGLHGSRVGVADIELTISRQVCCIFNGHNHRTGVVGILIVADTERTRNAERRGGGADGCPIHGVLGVAGNGQIGPMNGSAADPDRAGGVENDRTASAGGGGLAKGHRGDRESGVAIGDGTGVGHFQAGSCNAEIAAALAQLVQEDRPVGGLRSRWACWISGDDNAAALHGDG